MLLLSLIVGAVTMLGDNLQAMSWLTFLNFHVAGEYLYFAPLADILAAAGIRPATVIVTQGKRLLTRDQRVEDGETIDILSVVSGG